MHFSENLKQAITSLASNKLRSILTMLGIIMGVFSVVAIMAISNAAKAFMTEQFNSMGANTVMLQYANNDIETEDLMSTKDMANIVKAIDEVNYVASYSSQRGTAKIEKESMRASFIGVSGDYVNFIDLKFSSGRFINEMDNLANSRVVFIQDYWAKKYFGSAREAIGQEIKLISSDNSIIKCKVIGVESMDDDPFASMMNYDDYPIPIHMPLSTYQNFVGDDYLNRIDISVKDSKDLKAVGNKIVRLMAFTHNNEDKYKVESIKDIQKQVDKVLGTISMILLVIAIITLIVGGIGIVNILLVSVTERIREIGIRKALGAQKRDIVLQFLTESIMMTGTSGLIGITLGMICGAIISAIIHIPPVVDLKTILSTFFGSVILGIIFGVYPAKKAADLDPIESLRYE